MRNTFVRTRAVLDDCVDHIKVHNLQGSPIESYLVQHLLVTFCAEVQQEIHKSIDVYASTLNNEKLAFFVKNAVQNLLRSMKKTEIAGLLGRFGEPTKNKFNSLIDDTKITYYSIAVDARHDVAHKSGAQITINDFIKALDSADLIIQAVDSALHHQNTLIDEQ